jgi:diguanylate cyclase (GGDEF)-like protein
MKAANTIVLILLSNFIFYFTNTLYHFSNVYQRVFTNIIILTVIIIVSSSDVTRIREIRELKKELNKIKFKSEDERREIEILHSLNDISESFVHETNVDVIFEQTKLSIKKILSVDTAALFLCDQNTQIITQQISDGDKGFEVDRPILERTIQKGTSLLVNQLSPNHTEFRSFRRLYDQGFKSLMIAPIRMKDKITGLLGVFSRSGNDFTGTELRILTTFSTYVSIIMENGRLLEETQLLAITDEMTQLFNYRYFRQRLKEEFSRAERYEHPLSLVIFDIDYFKHYNDNHGHPKGDEVLRKLASLIKNNTRPTDFAARYGGEEFVIILIETDKEGAEMFAEKFRKCVDETYFEYQEKQPNKNLTVSVGVANFPIDAKNPDELLGMADKALYQAKNSGKNRVMSYSRPA